MDQLKSLLQAKNFVLLTLALVPVGLLFAPFLLSICMFASVALTLFRLDVVPRIKLSIRRGLQADWKTFWKAPDFWILMGFFLLTFWGFWQVQDEAYWMSRFRIKLPFLVLPFAFWSFPKLSRRTLDGLLYWMVLLLTLTSIGVLINYLADYEAINKAIQQGQPVPLPCNHVRFSLMLAFGVLVSLFLYFEKFTWRYQWERPLLLGTAIFLFAFIHFLSVRTGMVIIYATLFFLILRYIWLSKRYLLGLGLIAVMAASPVIAYQTMPSLRAKVDYVKYDLFMYRHGQELTILSDAARWVSLEIGWDIFKTQPVIGVGVPNLKQEVMQRYDDRFPDLAVENRKMPHNQYLSMMGATGIVGTLLFLGIFLIPIFYNKNYQSWLLLGFYISIGLSFMVENTIENAMGLGFYIFYLLLLFLRFRKPGVSTSEVRTEN